MKLVYIYHSGFAFEFDNFAIITDYYHDTDLKQNGYVYNQLLASGKQLYVLASHFHEDHFNAEVLQWKQLNNNIIYLFSKDILRHRKAAKEDAVWIAKGGLYSDDNISVRAFGSTDIGVSFCIEAGGLRIFHAGDLNNWHWNEESDADESSRYEKAYLGELKDIRKEIDRVDVALFPIDKRLGADYTRGAEQFLQKIDCRYFVPMHFSTSGFESANAFCEKAETFGCKYVKIHANGDSTTIEP